MVIKPIRLKGIPSLSHQVSRMIKKTHKRYQDKAMGALQTARSMGTMAELYLDLTMKSCLISNKSRHPHSEWAAVNISSRLR